MGSKVRLKAAMVFAVGLLSATLAFIPGWSCPAHAQEVAPENIKVTVETSGTDMETNFSLSVSQVIKQ
jgi:hypothetical protein